MPAQHKRKGRLSKKNRLARIEAKKTNDLAIYLKKKIRVHYPAYSDAEYMDCYSAGICVAWADGSIFAESTG